MKLASDKTCLGLSSPVVVYIFSLNTCEFLRPQLWSCWVGRGMWHRYWKGQQSNNGDLPLIHNRSKKMAQQQMGKKRCSYRREGLLCFKYTSFLWSYYFFVNPIFVGSPSRFCSCISLHSLWAAHSTYLFLCKE